MSPKNQWLEDVFPIENSSLFRGQSLVFGGVSLKTSRHPKTSVGGLRFELLMQDFHWGSMGEIPVRELIYLKDHPMTCKWLIAMVNKSPNWGYSPSKWPKWLVNGGY